MHCYDQSIVNFIRLIYFKLSNWKSICQVFFESILSDWAMDKTFTKFSSRNERKSVAFILFSLNYIPIWRKDYINIAKANDQTKTTSCVWYGWNMVSLRRNNYSFQISTYTKIKLFPCNCIRVRQEVKLSHKQSQKDINDLETMNNQSYQWKQ